MYVSAYRTNEGKPWVLPVVRKVEKTMAADLTLNKEYLPITGMPEFSEAATSLILGADSSAIAEKRVKIIHDFRKLKWHVYIRERRKLKKE